MTKQYGIFKHEVLLGTSLGTHWEQTPTEKIKIKIPPPPPSQNPKEKKKQSPP
jgi:hypothetical protein